MAKKASNIISIFDILVQAKAGFIRVETMRATLLRKDGTTAMENGEIRFDDKASFRKFVMPLSILVLTLIGTYLVSLYSTFFAAHKFLAPMPLIMNIKIDILGGILPLFIGLTCAALYFWQGGSRMIYSLCLLFSLAIVFAVSGVTAGGLMINPPVVLFGVSIVVVFFVRSFVWMKRKSVWKFKESYLSPLLVASSCIPFSLILVDLSYSPFFNNAIVGGNGLADGVLLSTIYSPFTVVLITLIFSFILQVQSQMRTCRRM